MMNKKTKYYRVRIKVTKPADKNVRYNPVFINGLVEATSPTESAEIVINKLKCVWEDKTLQFRIMENKNLRIDFIAKKNK